LRQDRLQIEPIDLGHVQIGNDTSGFVAATLVEKSRRRCIRLDAKPAGAQQPCDGQQERRVVVDDVDGRFR